MARILIIVIFITIIISIISIWLYPSVQDFMVTNAIWNGIKRFASEFRAEMIEIKSGLSSPLVEPEKTALLSMPNLNFNEENLLIIRNFINNGGTLLLMDDYGYANTLLAYLGTNIRFSKAPLLDPLFSFKNQRMPRITDFIPDLEAAGLKVLMFNHATALVNVSEAESISWSSKASFLDMDDDGTFSKGDVQGPLAVAAEVKLGKGKVVMVADPSIIINSMVGRDNNYDFIKFFTSYNGDSKRILIDSTHLAKTPLDKAKAYLSRTRNALLNPYALIGLVATIFVAVYRYTMWKGESPGGQL